MYNTGDVRRLLFLIFCYSALRYVRLFIIRKSKSLFQEPVPLGIIALKFFLLHDPVPICKDGKHLIHNLLKWQFLIVRQISYHPSGSEVGIQILCYEVAELLRIPRSSIIS